LGEGGGAIRAGYSYREIAEATGGGTANTIRTMASCAKWKRAEGPPPAPLASFDQTAITVRAADGAKRLSNEKFRDRVALIADHLLDILGGNEGGPTEGNARRRRYLGTYSTGWREGPGYGGTQRDQAKAAVVIPLDH
jgi:hypothetical protein